MSKISTRLVYAEIRFIRLFRMLTLIEKDELIREISEKLIARYPINPFRHLSTDTAKDTVSSYSRTSARWNL